MLARSFWRWPFWRLLLRPALIAIPFAHFFHFLSTGTKPFSSFLLAALVFSLVIAWCIEANTLWVAPRLARGGTADRGPALIREIASYFLASMIGSLIAAGILHVAVFPGFLGSGRTIVMIFMYAAIFGALFLLWNYFVIFRRRLVVAAEARGRHEQELRTAAAIQRALLPPCSYEAAACTAVGASIPCLTIGGDFFDYFELGNGCLAFALGDVAGKGPPAAILAGMVQGIFASNVGPDVPPAATIDRVNRALLRRAVEARFATLFYGCLDGGGRLVTCNAGHNAGLLLRADGGIRRLEAGGLMVGAFDFAAYQEEESALVAGDTLVLTSDGVTDAEAPGGEQFGEERLLACLERARHATPATILEAVLGEVRAFAAGRPPADDVTVLVVRYGNGSAASPATS